MIALTAGEPAGIGPDLCALLARERFEGRVVFVCDPDVVAERARMRGLAFSLPEYRDRATAPAMSVLRVSVAAPVVPGKLDRANARHVLAMLDRACDGCASGEFDAMVTAPVQKSVINDAGVAFTGHTEYLADRTHTARVVMLLVGGGLRVALATTHLALKDVPAAITARSLDETLRIVDRELRASFGVAKPRILVAGLNPHAGEGGYLGREEIEVVAPAVESAKRAGIDASGPHPADTLFTPRVLSTGDAVVAMFHDQGLPVLKHAAFGQAVNVTLGLPIVRTSVDHGTALDLAGRGDIDTGSFREAIAVALGIAARRRR